MNKTLPAPKARSAPLFVSVVLVDDVVDEAGLDDAPAKVVAADTAALVVSLVVPDGDCEL